MAKGRNGAVERGAELPVQLLDLFYKGHPRFSAAARRAFRVRRGLVVSCRPCRVLKELHYSVAVPPCQGAEGAKALSDQGLDPAPRSGPEMPGERPAKGRSPGGASGAVLPWPAAAVCGHAALTPSAGRTGSFVTTSTLGGGAPPWRGRRCGPGARRCVPPSSPLSSPPRWRPPAAAARPSPGGERSEEHTSELQ